MIRFIIVKHYFLWYCAVWDVSIVTNVSAGARSGTSTLLHCVRPWRETLRDYEKQKKKKKKKVINDHEF